MCQQISQRQSHFYLLLYTFTTTRKLWHFCHCAYSFNQTVSSNKRISLKSKKTYQHRLEQRMKGHRHKTNDQIIKPHTSLPHYRASNASLVQQPREVSRYKTWLYDRWYDVYDKFTNPPYNPLTWRLLLAADLFTRWTSFSTTNKRQTVGQLECRGTKKQLQI